MPITRFRRQSARVNRTTPVGPSSSGSLREEISRVAYELYERRGRIDGHAFEDWLEAERLVAQRRQSGRASR